MKKLRFLLRLKKGFTLVELIAVMAIMAIATSIVLPNIRGMISKKEESQYRNFCDEAVTYVKSYTSLLRPKVLSKLSKIHCSFNLHLNLRC